MNEAPQGGGVERGAACGGATRGGGRGGGGARRALRLRVVMALPGSPIVHSLPNMDGSLPNMDGSPIVPSPIVLSPRRGEWQEGRRGRWAAEELWAEAQMEPPPDALPEEEEERFLRSAPCALKAPAGQSL